VSRTSETQAVSRAHTAEAAPRAPTPHRHSWSAVPAAEGILRPRLLRRLDDVLAVRLAMVVGPPGSGKTTAMAQWARRAPVDVAWYRAVTADGHPDALLERLAETVEQVSAHRPPARLDGLLHALDQRDSPLVLVIDDLHLIAHPDVADLLQRLLTSMPPHVHVLTGSRRPPPFNLAQGELTATVVGTTDLRFRSPEVDRLFRTAYDAPLDQTDCLRLTRHTEGWAAALHLFHLQVTAQPPDERHRAVRGLAGQVRYAREYVGREILAPLPHELVDLLRTTSVLESLTGRRCDLLLGTTHSQRRLLELERRGVLTASTAGSGSFRLPTVLRAHLATQLRDELGDPATEAWLCDAARVTTVEPGPDGAAETVRLYAAAGAWAP